MARILEDGIFPGYDKNMSLEGKVAIITGAAGSIARSTAELFAEKGAKLALFDVSDRVAEVAAEISPDALGIVVDLTDVNAIEESVQKVRRHFGKIDILCNIAGRGHDDLAENITIEDWNQHLAVNLTGLFFMSQSVGKVMIEQGFGGKIINMASQAGIVGLPRHALYGAAKAGVINITKTLANEWGRYHINVNAVSPTVVLTPLAVKCWGGERGQEFLKSVPAAFLEEIL